MARRLLLRSLLVLAWVVLASGARASSGDEGFFFVHVSDVHTYRHTSQVDEHYGLGPVWTPRVVLAYVTLGDYQRVLVPDYADAVVPHMRSALGLDPAAGRFDLWDAWRYFNEILRRESELGDAQQEIREAFTEIHALRPAFIVNTGDIVFDSGKVPAEISADWMGFYREVSEQGGARVFNTIGNHELGLVGREDASPDDPLYGPGFFRHHFGSTTYGFDRGDFHFVALDSHSPDPDGGHWRYNRMRPEVKAWLEEDLAQHRERAVVILNHEPFFQDEGWKMREGFVESEVVDDEGLLERFGVAYTLTGHVHLPGSARVGATTHIANGALSGMHWVLPPEAAPRGIRLFYARGRELFGAFKRTGRPVLGFVRPAGAGDHFPASAPARATPAEGLEIVAVAADVAGPFASVRLELDGAPVPFDRWGDYFLRAKVTPAPGGSILRLVAERREGAPLQAELALPEK